MTKGGAVTFIKSRLGRMDRKEPQVFLLRSGRMTILLQEWPQYLSDE
jgi:hypothetical protein